MVNLGTVKYLLTILLFILPAEMYGQLIHIFIPDTALCKGTRAVFTATPVIANPHYVWYVNNVPQAHDHATFTIDTPATGNSVFCVLLNSALTPVDTSVTIGLRVDTTVPNAGFLTFAGNDTICDGSTTRLLASVPGGTWYSTGLASVDDSGVVTGHADGLLTCSNGGVRVPVFYVVHNGACADTTSAAVVVYNKPSAWFIVGNPMFTALFNEVCEGGTNSINNGNGPCGSFHSVNGFTSLSGWDNIYGIKAGTDTIYSSASNRCGTTTTRTIIKVLPRPLPITNPPVIQVCEHDTVSISMNDYPGTWTAANNCMDVRGNYGRLIFTGNKDGTGLFTIRYSNACGSAETNITTTVLPAPGAIIAADSTVCKDNVLPLSNSTAPGTWTSSNIGVAAINASGMLAATDTGQAVIGYTSSNGCRVTTTVKVIDCSVSSYSIYPNPAADQLIIQQDIPAYYDHYYVTSITGSKVTDGPITGIFKVIDISTLARGIYLLRISGSHGLQLSRFVKL